MIRIYYKNIGAAGWSEFDVDQNEVIRVTKQVLDYKDPSKRKSDLSKSFRLPFSENNNAIFGTFYDPSFDSSSYSAYTEFKVMVYSDTDLIFRGNLAMESIDRENPAYNVRIFGRLNTLKNVLGEALIGDLDWTEYNHLFSDENILKSWSGILDLLDGSTTDKILYPLSDWGKGYGYNGFDITSASTPVNSNDFYPAIQLEAFILGVFEKNGLVLDLSEFNYPDFDKVFYQLFVEKEKSIKARDFFFFADLSPTGNNITLGPDSNTTEVVTFTAVSNQSGVFDDTQNAFICSAGGSYTIKHDINGVWTSGDPNAGTLTVETQFYKNGSPISVPNTSVINKIAGTQDGTFNNNLQVTLTLAVGDVMDVRVTVDTVSAGFNVALVQPSEYKFISGPTVFLGGILDIARTMGDIKQVDFVRAFLNMWNLVIIQDPDIEQNFKVLPFDDWMDQGEQLDWTEIVDVSKPVIVKPATDYMKHDIDYQLKKTPDDLNKRYLDANGYPYGAVHIDTGIAYSDGSQKLFTIWAPYPTSLVDLGNPGDSRMYIARYYKDQDKPALEKIAPQLFFYNGVIPSGLLWKHDDGEGNIRDRIIYPNCSNFRYTGSNEVDSTSQDLNFAFNYPFDSERYIVEPTGLTIYNQYHFKYNARLYDLSNRILECSVYMSPDLFNSLKMNEEIIISLNGSPVAYRILTIKEFPINLEDSVNIILMKS